MPDVVYLMHVDWRWITQRPHFLAAQLRQLGAAVDVRYLPSWRRRGLVGRDIGDASPLVHLPPRTRYVRHALNPRLRRAQLARRSRPDFVWVTHPLLWSSVPHEWRDRVVYDAMDIADAFMGVDVDEIRAQEAVLCRHARAVFGSSQRILDTIEDRYHTDASRMHLIRNACQDRSDWPVIDRRQQGPSPTEQRAMYFGTVSEWFDADAIFSSLERHPLLTIDVVGPADIKLENHPRLRLHGAVPHEELLSLAQQATLFLMPFRRTALVEAVDPVKLYEYIALGRPVVSIYYPELEHFRGLVHFYDSSSNCADAIGAAAEGGVDADAACAFVANNTWSRRAREVMTCLASL